jgi:hypothetical protein
MGLVLRGKDNAFIATDQMSREGTAEVANSDDGGSHGSLHWMKLLEWSTDLAPVNDRMQIGGGTQAGHEALIGDTLQAPAYRLICGLSNILTIAFPTMSLVTCAAANAS